MMRRRGHGDGRSGGRSTCLAILALLLTSCASDPAWSSVPDGARPKEGSSPAPHQPGHDARALLKLVVADVLHNEKLRFTREHYCGPRVTRVGLSNKFGQVQWPAAFAPEMEGVRFRRLGPDHVPAPGAEPMLALDLDRLKVEGDRADIGVLIFHEGHGNIRGACFAVYDGRRGPGGWTVRLWSLRD